MCECSLGGGHWERDQRQPTPEKDQGREGQRRREESEKVRKRTMKDENYESSLV